MWLESALFYFETQVCVDLGLATLSVPASLIQQDFYPLSIHGTRSVLWLTLAHFYRLCGVGVATLQVAGLM